MQTAKPVKSQVTRYPPSTGQRGGESIAARLSCRRWFPLVGEVGPKRPSEDVTQHDPPADLDKEQSEYTDCTACRTTQLNHKAYRWTLIVNPEREKTNINMLPQSFDLSPRQLLVIPDLLRLSQRNRWAYGWEMGCVCLSFNISFGIRREGPADVVCENK